MNQKKASGKEAFNPNGWRRFLSFPRMGGMDISNHTLGTFQSTICLPYPDLSGFRRTARRAIIQLFAGIIVGPVGAGPRGCPVEFGQAQDLPLQVTFSHPEIRPPYHSAFRISRLWGRPAPTHHSSTPQLSGPVVAPVSYREWTSAGLFSRIE